MVSARCPFCNTVLVDKPDYPLLFCPVEYCSYSVDRSYYLKNFPELVDIRCPSDDLYVDENGNDWPF